MPPSYSKLRQVPGGGSTRGPERDRENALLSAEDNYTVILGSHRNTSLKIEKNGLPCSTVSVLFWGCIRPAIHACCSILHVLCREGCAVPAFCQIERLALCTRSVTCPRCSSHLQTSASSGSCMIRELSVLGLEHRAAIATLSGRTSTP